MSDKQSLSQDPLFLEIQSLAKKGQFQSALHQGRDAWGDERQWRIPEQLSILTRVYDGLGLERSAEAIRIHLYRSNPKDHDFAVGLAYYLLSEKGPIKAWDFVKQHEHLAQTDSQITDWLCLSAFVSSRFRDFQSARQYFEQAKSLDPELLWIKRTHAYLLSDEEKFSEAAQYLNGCYYGETESGVGVLRQFWIALAHSEGNDAVIELLEVEAQKYESMHPWYKLTEAYIERKDFGKAQQALDKVKALYLGGDRSNDRFIHSLQSAIYLGQQKYDSAIAELDKCPDFYSQTLKTNLETFKGEPKQVSLPVPRLRQKYMTCAPTTMAAIAQFLGADISDAEIAEKICFGGTYSVDELKWLTENDYVYKEFDLTFDIAVALIDAQLPFAMTTANSENNHLQAAVGYDLASGVLHLMDPSRAGDSRILVEQAVEMYSHIGPRCFVFLPSERAAELDGFDFPSSDQYQRHNHIQDLLSNYDFDKAQTELAQMAADYPDRRLTLLSERSLAIDLHDERRILQSNEKLIEKFPNQSYYRSSRFYGQLALGQREQALQELKERVNSHRELELIILEYHQVQDSLAHSERAKELSDLICLYCWHSSEALLAEANYLWFSREFERALQFYRWAMCLSDTQERYVRSYFAAARLFGQQDAAEAFLRQRFEEYGSKSAGPACSLYTALELLDKEHEGLEVLDQALTLRPEDAELIGFYLDKLLHLGQYQKFDQILDASQLQLPPTTKLSLMASKAKRLGNVELAIEQYDQLQQAKPLHLETLNNYFEQLTLANAESKIDERLTALSEEYGDSRTVLWGFARWHSDVHVQLENWQKLARAFLDDYPARRNYIDGLIKLRHNEDALIEAKSLVADAPTFSRNLSMLSKANAVNHVLNEAIDAAQQALKLDVDDNEAFYHLLDAYSDAQSKRKGFDFFLEQLLSQYSQGDGIWYFWCQAEEWLDVDTISQYIEQLRDKYHQVWTFPVVEALNLKAKGQVVEAINILEEGVKRFPLVARFHFELAKLHYIEKNTEEAKKAYHHTLELSPWWAEANRNLSLIYEAEGLFEQAEDILAKAARHNSDDGFLLGMLADLQYKRGEKTQALDNLKLAIRRAKSYDWAWNRLKQWSTEMGLEDQAKQLAQELCDEMPHLLSSWVNLAQHADDSQEAASCLLKAISLNPRNTYAHRELIELYVSTGQFDAAFEQIADVVWQDDIPVDIQYDRARVLAAQKRYGDACADVERLLQEHPTYEIGWRKLGQWRQILGRNEQAVEAMIKLVELSPHSADNLCIAAEIVSEVSEDESHRALAQKWLEQAFWLAPTDLYIANTWFDWLADSEQFERLPEVMEQMDKHHDSPFYLLRKLQYDCRVNGGKHAMPIFEEILLSNTNSIDLHRYAFIHMQKAGHADACVDILDKYIQSEKVHGTAAYIWALIRMRGSEKSAKVIEQYLTDNTQSPLWRMVCSGMLDHFSNIDKMPPKSFYKPHLERIIEDEMLYKDYLTVLFSGDKEREALKLLAEHEPNENWEAGLLYLYFWGLQDDGQYSRSKEILNLAVKATPDHTFENISLLLANEKFMHGEMIEESDLININFQGLNEIEQYIYVLLQAVLHVKERSFKDHIVDVKPILRHAQQLNQAVSGVDLAKTTRKQVRGFLKNTIHAGGFFDKLLQRFILSHLF